MLYKIGEFSKIVDIPVRTLRFYNESGLLQPKEIDRFTGYRYYSDENIVECEMIKLLKSLDFTLEEISLYKDNPNKEFLAQKQKEVEEKISYFKDIYKKLSVMQELDNDKPYIKALNEKKEDRILRRKYERRNIKKNY